MTDAIWTVGDFGRAAVAVLEADDQDSLLILTAHGPHESHCGGWEVLAWPCPIAQAVLNRHLMCWCDGPDCGRTPCVEQQGSTRFYPPGQTP